GRAGGVRRGADVVRTRRPRPGHPSGPYPDARRRLPALAGDRGAVPALAHSPLRAGCPAAAAVGRPRGDARRDPRPGIAERTSGGRRRPGLSRRTPVDDGPRLDGCDGGRRDRPGVVSTLSVWAPDGAPEVRRGDDLAAILVGLLGGSSAPASLEDGDVVVVT